ncbi:MAG: FeoB-associated Cys-rich membrane protein [Lachnospiraceae bacterium]
MNFLSIVIIMIIAVCCFFAIRYLIKNKNNGCCGDCSHCSHSCNLKK